MVAVAEAPSKDKTISLGEIQGQAEFVFDDRRYCLWIGGRGCAKTASGTFKLMRYLQENEGCKIVVLGPTYPQLRSGTMETIYEWLPPRWILRKLDSASDLRCDILIPGHKTPSRIYFRSSYNPDSFRSLEVAAVWADEIADCNPQALKILDACQRQKRPDGTFYPYQTWGTGTPRGQNWVFQRFIAKADAERVGPYFGTSYNNPFLPPGYTDELERSYTRGSRWWEQEVMGKFVAFEGLVYPDFSQEVHVKDPIGIKWRRVIGGMDFGISEASCVLLVGEDEAGRRWAFKEYYHPRPKLGELMGVIGKWRSDYNVQRYFCDPRAPLELNTLAALQIPITKANAEMETGVRIVSNLLAVQGDGKPGLYISPDCPNLIREMLSYCHDSAGYGDDTNFYDTIKKRQSDHALDTLRYAIMGAMGKTKKSNIVGFRF